MGLSLDGTSITFLAIAKVGYHSLLAVRGESPDKKDL